MENNVKNRCIQHLVESWIKYKLQTYPWDRKADDPGRQGREIAIMDEMIRLGIVPSKDRNIYTDHIEELVRDARKTLK